MNEGHGAVVRQRTRPVDAADPLALHIGGPAGRAVRAEPRRSRTRWGLVLSATTAAAYPTEFRARRFRSRCGSLTSPTWSRSINANTASMVRWPWPAAAAGAIRPPGSRRVRPLAGTPTCQVSHTGYCLSGQMTVLMDDGTRSEIGPGAVAHIPAGHDAWTTGNEACVFVDFGGLHGYAQPGR